MVAEATRLASMGDRIEPAAFVASAAAIQDRTSPELAVLGRPLVK
jgi:hypothetical protein